MTIQFAQGIVQRLGPCQIALDRQAHAELARELALIGCDVVDVPAAAAKGANGPTAGFLLWANPDPKASFADAIRPYRRMDSLILQSGGQDRRSLERHLFDAGWQRHPAGMSLGEYPAWSGKTLPPVTYYQRAPHGGASELQKGSIDADASIARYAMAANHIRPADHVLVDGIGAADGAAIIMALSRADSIIRVGPKPKPGQWAARSACQTTDASLAGIADNSIDMIVALEPVVPDDWVARLDDYARILKCDGRIVLGWRQGVEGSRPDDWATMLEGVSDRFLPETRYVQMAISADPTGPHALFAVAMDQPVAADWLFIVAAANPLAGEGRGGEYDHPAYPTAMGDRPALVDFGAAYDNPYLYRSMVQMGERLTDEVKLARLAECVIEDSREDSADRGAAIAVLGYRLLEMRLPAMVPSVLPLIEAYIALPLCDDTPVHVRRWRISLAFLAGRLNELTGDRDAAMHWYRESATGEWSAFSPLLATKAIAASFYEARLCLANGDVQTARECFTRGVDTALEAAAFPHREQMGPAERPISFYLTELAEVIDMGSQCANALANFHLWERDPGLFWRQVDVRRFGMASWARDLERENAQLRAA
ncbi:hypothetical protein [Sphingomonas sp. SRS2]|uniref:hypothetical protein n=1 Tax=Sphingomonas sp. SRS2 TaxID=133190 RepID=UPI00061DFA6E|nr:hypothetical protein [Sphingomonas sp. SRS2]KKC27810.1 hypothetical protein WP12_01130 [Sphingomonas sp. SRS2]